MSQSLLDEESSGRRWNSQTNTDSHSFMVDVLCTVSRHKIANVLLSYIHLLYLFSSIALSMMDRQAEFTTVVKWYDYAYLVITGSFLNSGVNEMRAAVAFSAIYTLCISILVFILALILMRSRLSYPAMRHIFIALWFYVIPLFGPFVNNTFSRSYSVLSIEDDTLFFLLIVLANAVHLIPVFCSAFVNTVSAYDIDHISCANNPIQGVVMQVSLLLSHQLLGFLEHSSNVVYVVMAIVLMALAIYTVIDPPLLHLHLCVSLLAYYIFSFSTAVISLFNHYSLYSVLMCFIGAILVSVFVFCVVRYCIAKRIGGYQEIRAMMFFGKNITEKVNIELKQCTDHQLWTISRASDKIDIPALESVLNHLESQRNKDYLQSFFNSSLSCLVAERKGTIPHVIMSSLMNSAVRQEVRKRRFWESVWSSDVQQIRKNACIVGKHRFILEQNLLENKKMYGSVPELTDLIDRTQRQKKRCCCQVSGYEIILVFVAILSLFSTIDVCLLARNTTCINADFLLMRETLASFSLALSDVWCDSVIGTHFDDFLDLWNESKASKRPAVQQALKTSVTENTLCNLTDIYLQELVRYAQSDFSDPGSILPRNDIFTAYESIFSVDSDFYASIFGPNTPSFEKSLRYIILILNLLAVVYFIVVLSITSKTHGKLCQKLMSISKSQICRFAGPLLESAESERVHVPMAFKKIEWKSAKYDLLALVCSLIVMNTIWFFRELYRHNTQDIRYAMETHFANFAHSDLTNMWLSFAYLRAFMQRDTTYAAIQCDQHLNSLFHYSLAESFLSLFPANMRYIVGYLLSDEKTVRLQEEAQNSLIYVNSELVNMAVMYAAARNLILLQVVVFLLSIVLLLLISFPIIRMISTIPRCENSELKELWSEFVMSEGTEEREHLRRYNPKHLPFVIIKVNSDGKIAFATKKAMETYNINREHVFFSDIDFGFVKTTEINKALNERRYKREVIIIDIDGILTYIYPIFHSDELITDIDSFVFVEMDKSIVHSDMPMDVKDIVKRMFPAIKQAQLPECDEFDQTIVSIVSLRIMNIERLVETESLDVFDKFVKEIIGEMDKAASECQFKRLTVRGNTFDFVCDTEEQKQVQSVFIKTCVSFSSRLLSLISTAVEKYSFHGVHGSAVFFKSTQPKYHIGWTRCAQAGLIGSAQLFANLCHLQFSLNGIALATPHKPNNKIADMSKIATFQESSGKQFDLFIVVK